MGAVVACATCGTELRENARFCDECGSATTSSPRVAEYKQVTVLFADVVHSMDIAKAVGAERLLKVVVYRSTEHMFDTARRDRQESR